MRIVQVNSSDCGGGAEAICMALHREYRAAGHDAWVAVGERRSTDMHVVEIPNDALRNPWARFWAGRAKGPLARAETAGRFPIAGRLLELAVGQPGRFASRLLGREDFAFPASRTLPTLLGAAPDLIHAHNLHGRYFDLRQVPALCKTIPVVLTLHDAWLLSGHCAHSFDCDRWLTGCGHCPDLSIYPEIWRDGTAGNFQRKAAIYRASRVCVATPSQWLMERVQRSMVAPAIVEARVIPNGVDLDMFQPGDAAAARAALALPQDADVILFAGRNPRQNPFKDYATLETAMQRLGADAGRKPCVLVVLGDQGDQTHHGNVTIRPAAFCDDPAQVARFYHAADLYVQAAKADTFPTTVLEALACGKPVVGSAVAGISEQIEQERSGMLVPPGRPEELAQALRRLLDDAGLRRQMGQYARACACRRFDQARMAAAYLQWFEEILHRVRT